MSVLVLGIGNVLWGDEGFGVRCAEAFHARFEPHAAVTVLDGGTQGLYLLPFVQSVDRLLVFDAIDFGLAPATLKVLEGDEVPRFMGAKKMSLHQTGFQEVLACAQLTGALPAQLVLIGVQPEELEDFGGSLRDSVKAQIPRALDCARAVLGGWGIALQERPAGAAATGDGVLGLAAYEGGRPDPEQACRTGDPRVLGSLVR